jgi:hypothetical protein
MLNLLGMACIDAPASLGTKKPSTRTERLGPTVPATETYDASLLTEHARGCLNDRCGRALEVAKVKQQWFENLLLNHTHVGDGRGRGNASVLPVLGAMLQTSFFFAAQGRAVRRAVTLFCHRWQMGTVHMTFTSARNRRSGRWRHRSVPAGGRVLRRQLFAFCMDGGGWLV